MGVMGRGRREVIKGDGVRDEPNRFQGIKISPRQARSVSGWVVKCTKNELSI